MAALVVGTAVAPVALCVATEGILGCVTLFSFSKRAPPLESAKMVMTPSSTMSRNQTLRWRWADQREDRRFTWERPYVPDREASDPSCITAGESCCCVPGVLIFGSISMSSGYESGSPFFNFVQEIFPAHPIRVLI